MVELCSAIPDGIVAFFTSYSYMESIISEWDGMGIMRQLTKSKLVFIETKDVVETTMALDNFRRACDSGRGAVFLSVARGKVRLVGRTRDHQVHHFCLRKHTRCVILMHLLLFS
jgi:DNA excision repair protein ERCC-2